MPTTIIRQECDKLDIAIAELHAVIADKDESIEVKNLEIARLQKIIDDLQNPGPDPDPDPDPEPGEFHYYIAPNGTGDGSSEAKAASISTLDAAIAKVGAGGRIGLIADQGPYTNGAITIRNGGANGLPVTISGVRGHAKFIGTRNAGAVDFNTGRDVGDGTTIWKRPWVPPKNVEGWQPVNAGTWGNQGNELFRLVTGANNLVFEKIDPERRSRAFVCIDNIRSITIQDCNFFNCDSHIYSAYDPPNGWDGMTVRRCTFTGIANDALRGTGNCKNTLIEDCVADSGFLTGGKFIMCFLFNERCDGVTIRRTTAKNGVGSFGSDYFNGDGFVFEREVTNVVLEDCYAEHFSDGGFDCKSLDVRMTRCKAKWCKKSFRIWNGGTLIECESIDPRKTVIKNINHDGGSGAVVDLQAHGGTVSTDPKIVRLVRCPNITSIERTKHSTAPAYYGNVVRE